MIAVLINSLAILIGGLLGLGFRKLIKKEIFEEILKAVGLVIIIFGLAGVF